MRSRREVDDLGIRSLGVIPRMMACTRSRWLSSTAARASFGRSGQHAQQVADGTHLADRQHLLEEVLQRQLAGTDLGRRLGLLRVEDLFGLLDQGQHIPHPEDAAGHPVGVEDVEVLQLFPGGGERMGTPVISRTDNAAPPRASPSSLVSTTPVKPRPVRRPRR